MLIQLATGPKAKKIGCKWFNWFCRGENPVIKLFKGNLLENSSKIKLIEMMKTCITTNKVVTNDFVEFKCPQCGSRIIRSLEARNKALPYTCTCGFIGP